MKSPDVRSLKEYLRRAVGEAQRAEDDIQYGNLLGACDRIEVVITHILTAYEVMFKERMEGTGDRVEAVHKPAYFSSPEALSHA